MLAWMEDCILYKFDSTDIINGINELTSHNFESIVCKEMAHQVFEIQYTWIDPIRMKDKLIARDQKSVTFWIFNNEKIMSCFGNSESAISYAVQNMMRKTSIKFKRINTFDHWFNWHYQTKKWFASLIGIHQKRIPTVSDEREILKINIRELTAQELDNLFEQQMVTNLTFSYKSTIFYLDLASVISFPDTIKEKEIFDVIKNIAGDINEIHS